MLIFIRHAEARNSRYTADVFQFRDPYSLKYFRDQLSELQAQSLSTIFLKLPDAVPPSYYSEYPKSPIVWRKLWSTLATLPALRTLRVNLTMPLAMSLNGWLTDLSWVDDLKQVTTPTDFEVIIPVQRLDFAIDTSPSQCRITIHPCISTPEYMCGVTMRDFQDSQSRCA